MKKLALLAMVLGIGGVIGISSFASADDKPAPCHRKIGEFKTQLVHDACVGADEKSGGGQPAAKAAMKQFLKDNKSKKPGLDCTTCHVHLAPDYPLKGTNGEEGLKTFESLGGKLLAAPAAPAKPAKP